MTSIQEQIDALQGDVDSIVTFMKTIPASIGMLSNKLDQANASLAKISDIAVPPPPDLSGITNSLDQIQKTLAPVKIQDAEASAIKGEKA